MNPAPKRSNPRRPIDNDDIEANIRALRRYARALVGSPADADDLVQETLKRALIYLNGDKEIRNLRSYLLTMLHHVRVDFVMRRRRQGEPLSDDDAVPAAAGPRQTDHLVCSEIVEAIHALPEEQREVLLLAGLEGYAYREVAEILRVPIGTVMSRLNRGRAALRRALDLDATGETGMLVGQLEGGEVTLYPSSLRGAA